MNGDPVGKREPGWFVSSPEGPRRRGDISESRAAVGIHGWQINQRPFFVKIPLDIVDRLEQDIQHGLAVPNSYDVMGLLIGRMAKDRSTLIIQDYVITAYTSDCASPAVWNDERVAEMGEPWSRLNSPEYVVGFFRSYTRDWPEIEREILEGSGRLLRSTPNVFLLIRSELSHTDIARLFLRPSRRARFMEQHGEFPLSSDILRAQCHPPAPKREQPALHFVPGNPPQGMPRRELAKPANGSSHVDAILARVKRSDRNVPLNALPSSAGIVSEQPDPPLAPCQLSEAETPKNHVAEPAETIAEVSTPAASTTPKRRLWAKFFRSAAAEGPRCEPLAAAKDTSNAFSEPEAEEVLREPATQLEENPPPTPSWRSWLSVAATGIIAVGTTMWFMQGATPLNFRPDGSQARRATPSNPIGLRVDKDGGSLNIFWDRASAIAKNSSAGFLTIRDGSLLTQVRLDSTEIRTEHIYYGARGEDLGIRLELVRGDGGMATESVRVLGPSVSGSRPPHK